jgi:N-methylhydantoinase A/oxoprolinase/acetone carboxylase beta subunit
MARALKRVSVARGVDPRRMTLVPFGGAGPLFGCALADALGIRSMLVPPHPGVLSALGLAAAPERVELLAPFHRLLARLTAREIADLFQPLLERAAATLAGATLVRSADCRFVGQGYEVAVPAPADDAAALARDFLAEHRARHGHADPTLPIELVQVRVTAVRPGVAAWAPPGTRGAAPTPGGGRAIVVGGRAVEAALWPLGGLPVGAEVRGPAILAGPDATALVEPGWHGQVHVSGAVVLERSGRPVEP